jgi:serine/threonine-protein kinase HipA
MIPDIKKIEVFFRDTLAGILQTDPYTGVCVFEYSKAWLAGGFPLSPTELPLAKGLIYADKERMGGAFTTFEDSLPDGYGLYLIDRLLKRRGASLRELSPLQRLSLIGTGGMGALSYRPVTDGFGKQGEISEEINLDTFQEEVLSVLTEKEAGDPALLYYNSANSGGARPKAALRAGDGSHWIVKFRQTYDPASSGRTEFRYMNTAAKCGITVPRMKLLDGKYFASERFDMGHEGKRLHVLTAAALLKSDFRSQSADYTNLLALTGYLTQSPVQVEQMFRRMVMNLVAINKDDHSKNFSFICDEGNWTLAPAYDITYSPAGSNGEHATSLFYDGNPGLDLVLKAGTQIRIPRERCLEIITDVESVCKENLPKVECLSE